MIERSSVDKVQEDFELFVQNNASETSALNCKNGKFIGLTPPDDYGYIHIVFLEINQGKIIYLHYDELKANGENKRTDIDYNKEMLKSGTSPSIAYPIYAVSYTHLRAHETRHDLVCRLLLEKKKK